MYGLYIHIPFCKKKCNYCDFISYPDSQNLLNSYLESLYTEMDKYSGKKIKTIYIGGGTPSVLTIPQIKDLFNNIRKIFSCSNLSEITFEANPESLNEEKVRTLKTCGVNRLSIGAQSLNDNDLKYLGRLHNSDDLYNILRIARKYEFTNLNIDLIYGLPGQTIDEWKALLKKSFELNMEHLSIYPLTIEDNTNFCNRNIIVNEEDQARMYEYTIDNLKASGYEHYEISNWAKQGYRCKHNLIYWNNQEYIGIGVAAASYFEGKRYKNCLEIKNYIENIKRDENTLIECEEIDDNKRLVEELILKLRCSFGVDLNEKINNKYSNKIEQLIGEKLIEKKGNNIALTKKGYLLANQVLKEFV